MAIPELQEFQRRMDTRTSRDNPIMSQGQEGLSNAPMNRPGPRPPIPVPVPQTGPQMATASQQMPNVPQQMPTPIPEISPVEKAQQVSVSQILAPIKADLIEIFFRKAGGNPENVVAGLMGNATRDSQGLPVAPSSQGGIIELATGGDFRGRVAGDGHGMEDNVYMPIQEGPEQVGTLAVSPKEYVVDAHTMSALGNGNADKGADVMDRVVENVREKAYGTRKQPREINGLAALGPMIERV
tara:strand:- start:765 stop:1487 length:723 start_codon:yes stop_codon:yes gene_type:complete